MPALGDVTQDFAADTGGACLAIGHDTLGRRDDGHTQTVLDLRDGIATAVDAQARTAHALNALDDGTASVVLQSDLKFTLANSLIQ